MTNPNTNERVSPFTSVTLSLGTGEECNNKTNPLNLSHLSNEHLEGLWVSANEERNNRKSEKLHTGVGSLLDIGLEQGTTDNETDYIDQCG
jgi:hypothetical protein